MSSLEEMKIPPDSLVEKPTATGSGVERGLLLVSLPSSSRAASLRHTAVLTKQTVGTFAQEAIPGNPSNGTKAQTFSHCMRG